MAALSGISVAALIEGPRSEAERERYSIEIVDWDRDKTGVHLSDGNVPKTATMERVAFFFNLAAQLERDGVELNGAFKEKFLPPTCRIKVHILGISPAGWIGYRIGVAQESDIIQRIGNNQQRMLFVYGLAQASVKEDCRFSLSKVKEYALFKHQPKECIAALKSIQQFLG